MESSYSFMLDIETKLNSLPVLTFFLTRILTTIFKLFVEGKTPDGSHGIAKGRSVSVPAGRTVLWFVGIV